MGGRMNWYRVSTEDRDFRHRNAPAPDVGEPAERARARSSAATWKTSKTNAAFVRPPAAPTTPAAREVKCSYCGRRVTAVGLAQHCEAKHPGRAIPRAPQPDTPKQTRPEVTASVAFRDAIRVTVEVPGRLVPIFQAAVRAARTSSSMLVLQAVEEYLQRPPSPQQAATPPSTKPRVARERRTFERAPC